MNTKMQDILERKGRVTYMPDDRGIEDERAITKQYGRRLLVGLVIITLGMLANYLSNILGKTSILAPNPAGQRPILASPPGVANSLVGVATLVVGSVINVYAIYKYSRHVSVTGRSSRVRAVFMLIGVLLSFAGIIAGVISLL